jgi:hypothetical protein
VNNKLTPYCISIYNGTKALSAFINKNMDQNKLFNDFIKHLLTQFENGNNTLTVYAHNLSEFDGVLLMKHLLNHGKTKPLIHNGKLISIKLNIKGHKTKTIIFKDSLLMLPLSLRELCNSFKIEISKGYFPFLLNDLTYKGEFPKFELFTSLSLTEYLNLKNQYSNKIWSFKDEAIKYCELDCVSLHQVLTKFSELIFNEFKVDPIKVLTLPALAMKIWKTFYMPKDTVFQLGGQPQELIRESYTGGAVDVYIPHNSDNEILFDYDVNALYPSAMLNNLMPVGKPIPFLGNIRNIDPQAFGFFYCKISSPEYLEHPILQRRIKTVNGNRTIAGLGTWEGWIFSEEMDNAVKYGYTFEIFKGYEFNKADIFSKYINKMFNLRLQYPKGDAMNLTAKLLLNSLYGKFGMKIENTMVEIFNLNTEAGKLALKNLLDTAPNSVKDFIEFDSNKYLFVKDTIAGILNEDSYHGSDVNIAIASTITAGARIFMSAFKNNPLYNLYYSDTDSIVIDKTLNPRLVGAALGLLKLEYVISRAVFLAPKVYGFITQEGDEVIKVKGVTQNVASGIHINDLEHLLIKDSHKIFNQQKWHKSLTKGEIGIHDVLYNLKVTSNKREAIYVDGIYNNTEPLHYDEVNNEEINK